ncbi:hypothetical protein U1Q18_032414 [Sarracenia purpurea var. burkii]
MPAPAPTEVLEPTLISFIPARGSMPDPTTFLPADPKEKGIKFTLVELKKPQPSKDSPAKDKKKGAAKDNPSKAKGKGKGIIEDGNFDYGFDEPAEQPWLP